MSGAEDRPRVPPPRPGRPEEDPDRLRPALESTWRAPGGWRGFLVSTDHKTIALRFIGTAFGFFVLGGILAFFMRLQLARPLGTVLHPDVYDQFFTTHGTTMMFLFAVPVMQGMGLYLVPLMVGTRNVAFPRMLNFGYWMFLISGLMLYGGLIVGVAPDAGWFAYTPLSESAYSIGHRMDVWAQMVTVVEISTIVTAAEIVTAILKQRAPGMTLDRMPVFVWAQLVTSIMIVFAMPAVQLASTMLGTDRLPSISTQFFQPTRGGDTLLWQHLFWYFGHPEVYIVFLPASGFVSEILATFTGRPTFGYLGLVLALVSTGLIGFWVWMHHMFATPLPDIGQTAFTTTSLSIVIPGGLQIFCWVATLWRGAVRLATPMLFTLGFLVVFVIGGLTGVMLASVGLDLQLHDTYFVVAHLHYVLMGGGVFPLFGAFYYWYPKWTGRMMSERLGAWNFWLLFVGFNLTFFPMHILGLEGMTRRVYTYLPETGWGTLNLPETFGATLIAASVVLFLVNVVRSRTRGRTAGENPWNAPTLEWATSSPPPAYNFAEIPVVSSRTPLWTDGPRAAVVTGLSVEEREILITTAAEAEPDHRFHLARESIWPFVTALIAGGTFIALIFRASAVVYGAVLALIAMSFWFAPGAESNPLRHRGPRDRRASAPPGGTRAGARARRPAAEEA